MPRVEVPPALTAFTGSSASIELAGDRVGDILMRLRESCPDLGCHILQPDGSLRPYVNAYVNDRDIRRLELLDTPLEPTDVLTLVPSLAGG